MAHGYVATQCEAAIDGKKGNIHCHVDKWNRVSLQELSIDKKKGPQREMISDQLSLDQLEELPKSSKSTELDLINFHQ